MVAKRRDAFAPFYYQYFGSPPREKWSKAVSYIAHLLKLPPGSRDAIYRVFEDCEHAENNNEVYSSSANAHKSGRKKLIVHGTPEADIIFNIIEKGLGSTAATWVVNAYFTRRGEDIVSLQAVKNFVKYNPCVIIERNTAGKSGKDDEGSTWAQARVAQCLQYIEQIRIGALPVGAAVPENSPPPLKLDRLVLWDEKHFEQRLGPAGKHQTRVSRTADGMVAPPSEGGVFKERLKNMSHSGGQRLRCPRRGHPAWPAGAQGQRTGRCRRRGPGSISLVHEEAAYEPAQIYNEERDAPCAPGRAGGSRQPHGGRFRCHYGGHPGRSRDLRHLIFYSPRSLVFMRDAR